MFKTRRLVSNFTFAVCISLSVELSRAAPLIQPRDVLAIFGDSNTEAGSFPRHLANARLSRVINAGHGGETALSAYWAYLDDLMRNERFAALFVLFGLNDIAWGSETRPHVLTDFRSYYLEGHRLIAQRASSRGVQVFFLSYPPTEDSIIGHMPGMQFSRSVGHLSRDLNSPFLEWYKAALAENAHLGVQGIDLYSPMLLEQQPVRTREGATGPLFHTADGGHLNERGNLLLTKTLLQAIAH
jgi:lysophospholipase L1-like esterase